MLVLIIFVLTDVLVVTVFMAVYCRKPKYRDHMLLGVHIPPYGVHNPEVIALIDHYQKRSKHYFLINGILSVAVCFLNLWYMSVFIVVWSFWLLGFALGTFFLSYGTHRKLYDLKMERGWQGSVTSGIVVVDTNVSADRGKLPLSIWWHLPVLVSIFLMAVFPSVRNCIAQTEGIKGLLISSLAMFLFFAGMHIWTTHNRDEVLSQGSTINQTVNQIVKRVWSMLWIGTSYLNLLSVWIVVYDARKTHWLSALGIIGYISIQSMAGVGVLGVLLYLRWKKQDLLETDANRIYLDDDIYWKNGWYNNPHDSKVWVQDRMNCMNYTVNMGRTGGRVYVAVMAAVLMCTFGFIFAMFLKVDFTPRYLSVEGNTIMISSPMAPISLKKQDVQEVELLSELPEGSYSRTNGLDDGRQLVGKFRERELGACRLYIYSGYTPVLKIVLNEYTIFINSKDSAQTKRWYEWVKR